MFAVGIDGCSNGWLASFSKPFDFKECYCLYSKNLEEAHKLWSLSEEMVGQTFDL